MRQRSSAIKKLLIFIITVLCLIFSACSVNKDEEIHRVFQEYYSALEEGDGERAVLFVDNMTISAYEELLSKIIYLDKEEVIAEPLVLQMMIFRCRQLIPREKLLEMNGRDLFVYGWENGLMDMNRSGKLEIRDVRFSFRKATADVFAEGSEYGLRYNFRYESGSWKMDLASLFTVANDLLENQVKDLNISREEFVSRVVDSLSGKDEIMADRLLNPVVARQ